MSETLKYLSALRLLAVMTAEAATNMTQELLGEPLYSEGTTWYAARTKADTVMKQISSPFFDWA